MALNVTCCFLNPFSVKIGHNIDRLNMTFTRASEPTILLLMLVAALSAPVNAQVVSTLLLVLKNDGAVYFRSFNFLRLTSLGQWRCCGVAGVQLNCLPIFDFFRSRARMCFCISSHYLNRLATINFFALTLPTVVSQNPLPVQVSFINRLIPKFSILSNRGVPLFLDAGGECFAFELGTCYQVFVITIF